jgi:hypothetical protein
MAASRTRSLAPILIPIFLALVRSLFGLRIALLGCCGGAVAEAPARAPAFAAIASAKSLDRLAARARLDCCGGAAAVSASAPSLVAASAPSVIGPPDPLCWSGGVTARWAPALTPPDSAAAASTPPPSGLLARLLIRR